MQLQLDQTPQSCAAVRAWLVQAEVRSTSPPPPTRLHNHCFLAFSFLEFQGTHTHRALFSVLSSCLFPSCHSASLGPSPLTAFEQQHDPERKEKMRKGEQHRTFATLSCVVCQAFSCLASRRGTTDFDLATKIWEVSFAIARGLMRTGPKKSTTRPGDLHMWFCRALFWLSCDGRMKRIGPFPAKLRSCL